ncbi:MAG: hypothetical protein KJ725_17245 [Gammaproteobacteria bacterium]|uniref:hypothetical protein n=1 Tax=Methylotuvimicrobium sp. TaxID=2822413 RepID=UPI001E04F13F|nr:hypothetical protein [Gammaproteobacteria bacterium]
MKRNLSLVFLLLFLCPVLLSAQTAEPVLETVPSRPDSDAGATQVSVGLWLIDIDSINSAQQNFVVNVYMVLQWHDSRLAHGRKDTKRYKTIDVWTPRVQIANEIGIVRSTMAQVVDVAGDGTVTYRQRYVGPLSQALRVHEFPFDKHSFRIHLVSMNSGVDDVQFVPKADIVSKGLPYAAGISKDISLPDWTVESFQTSSAPYVINEFLQAPGYAFDFKAKRDSEYYLWKVLVPLGMIVAMSWIAFWIDPKELGVNVSAVMTSMLTLVAYRFTVENYIPKVGYLTRMDKFMLWSSAMVFLSMMHVAINSILVEKGRRDIAVKLDRCARLIYPVIFTLITIVSLVV